MEVGVLSKDVPGLIGPELFNRIKAKVEGLQQGIKGGGPFTEAGEAGGVSIGEGRAERVDKLGVFNERECLFIVFGDQELVGFADEVAELEPQT